MSLDKPRRSNLRRQEECEGKRTRKSLGLQGKRKSRAENHPERDGDGKKETENRARERDAKARTRNQTASTKAQSD